MNKTETLGWAMIAVVILIGICSLSISMQSIQNHQATMVMLQRLEEGQHKDTNAIIHRIERITK